MSRDHSKLVEKIINKMFELSGHDVQYQQLLGRTDDWYNQYTITEEKETEWIKFGVDAIRKDMKVPKYIAENEMRWIHVTYGLKTIK